jgi:transposase-like protein
MPNSLKRFHSAEFKTSVVLEIFKEDETLNQIASRFTVHPTQVKKWKELALIAIKDGFNQKGIVSQLKEKDNLIDTLYQQIGKLDVAVEWLKKRSTLYPR